MSIVLIFVLGWLSSTLVSGSANIEQPFSFNSAPEQPSPHDRLSHDDIHVYDDRVQLDIDGAEWAYFTDTNSMDPVIDEGANAIEIIPKDPSEIHVGDIASYSSKYSEGTIIHRVVDISSDENGWYATMKGDNVNFKDPERVRFTQVKRVVVAIIY